MVARTEARQPEQLAIVDPIWGSLLHEARSAVAQDPLLSAFLYSTILNHRSLEECVIYRICELLDHPDMQAVLLRQTFQDMLDDWPEWGSVLRVDIQAVYDRDPACTRFMEPLLYFKGFRPSRRIALPIGCCKRAAGIWRFICKAARPAFSRRISIRQHASARVSSSIMPPGLWSARRPLSATTFPSCMA